MQAGILAVLVPCGPWLDTSEPCNAPLSFPVLMQRLSSSACATSLVYHPSVGDLAAWVAQ